MEWLRRTLKLHSLRLCDLHGPTRRQPDDTDTTRAALPHTVLRWAPDRLANLAFTHSKLAGHGSSQNLRRGWIELTSYLHEPWQRMPLQHDVVKSQLEGCSMHVSCIRFLHPEALTSRVEPIWPSHSPNPSALSPILHATPRMQGWRSCEHGRWLVRRLLIASG